MDQRQAQKRPRSPECEECLPISKRINRLQIENDRRQSEEEKCIDAQAQHHSNMHQPVTSEQNPPMTWNMHQPATSQQNPPLNPCQECAGNNNLPYDIVQGYNPELTDMDNPQYYNINNMLFKAHYDRVLRQRTPLQYPNT